MNIGHKKFVIYFSTLVSLALILVFTINVLVDPLWYFGGNKLFPENYSFNERFSKVNQYLNYPKNYNCILFGSSRVTLLDANKISGYNCFNFSFSDGKPNEFVEYAKYILNFGVSPDLAIVGIDARFFSRGKPKNIVPQFVKSLKMPPGFIKTYLSFNAFNFSLRTLLRKAPQHRYYTDKLIGDVLTGTNDYYPPRCFTLEGFAKPYTEDNIVYIKTLKQKIKSHSFIAYVAPISAWDMLPLLEDGEIYSYISIMYKLSKQFDRFYDFSIPSALTNRTDNNYDGHHFSRRSNNEIAKILTGQPVKYGVAVHKMRYIEYKTAFITRLEAFAKQLGGREKSSWDCPHRSAVR